MNYAVGVDAGGTATRAMAVAADGTVLAIARAGGANPNSHPPEQAAAAVGDALADAVAGLGPPRACVVGMAGTSKLTDPAVATLFERVWRDSGVAVTPRVVTDAEVAFASATTEPDGTVLVAGTGSIAGRIRARRLVSSSGGYGWLLGDEGSAFWIGREAVRTTLDAITRGADPGPLGRAVLAEAAIEPAGSRPDQRLITAANTGSPVRLARFAPLVSATADRDPAANAIAVAAAGHLVALASAAREPGERTPVVLVGGVLAEGGPVGVLVRTELRGDGDDPVPVLGGADGVAGAAWLAALDAFGPAAARPAPEPS